jgi:hypothetical protein
MQESMMELSEMFTDDEILNLRLAASRVFNLISENGEKLDKKEVRAYEKFISKARRLEIELAVELFTGMDKFQVLDEQRKSSGLDDREGLRYISALLDRKSERDVAVDYKKTLLALGYYIANASGSIFGDKVDDDEITELILIGNDLELSYREMFNSNQIQRIISMIEE